MPNDLYLVETLTKLLHCSEEASTFLL